MIKLFRIEKIKLKPLLLLAHTADDAANILGHAFISGMGNRPDADFDVVKWTPAREHYREPLVEWLRDGHRGIVWLLDEGCSWELAHTGLVEP